VIIQHFDSFDFWQDDRDGMTFDEGAGLQSIYGSYPLMAKELKGKRQPVRVYLKSLGRSSLTEAVMKKEL